MPAVCRCHFDGKKHVETQAKEILARCEKLQSRDLTQKSLVYREDEHVIPVYVAEVEVLAKSQVIS